MLIPLFYVEGRIPFKAFRCTGQIRKQHRELLPFWVKSPKVAAKEHRVYPFPRDGRTRLKMHPWPFISLGSFDEACKALGAISFHLETTETTKSTKLSEVTSAWLSRKRLWQTINACLHFRTASVRIPSKMAWQVRMVFCEWVSRFKRIYQSHLFCSTLVRKKEQQNKGCFFNFSGKRGSF